MPPRSYQETVALTVQEQLARAEANELFKQGRLDLAAEAYERAFGVAQLDENKLPLLANLGLCNLRLACPDAAADCLGLALTFGAACYASPNVALKAAGRRLEACQRLGDKPGERAAIATCHFYRLRSLEKGGAAPPKLDVPEASAEAVTALLMAVGGAEDDADVGAVRERLKAADARAESLDSDRMHALALSVHIECLRPALRGALLAAVLEGGTPADARVEQGRTPLMLAANNGRLDLCEALLAAGADAACTDGAGLTALHSAVADCHLAAERVEAGLACDPAAVVALLLRRGAPAAAGAAADGATALTLCQGHHQAEHESARACAALLLEASQAAAAPPAAVVGGAGADEEQQPSGGGGGGGGGGSEDAPAALREAARKGDLPALQALLSTAGVDVDSTDDDDETALHFACRADRLEVVKALLAAGANPKATNESARTPLDVAREYHSASVVTWMEAVKLHKKK